MLTRLITGIVIVCVMMLAILYLPVIYFAGFCAVILAIAANEWFDFAQSGSLSVSKRPNERAISPLSKIRKTKLYRKFQYFILLVSGLFLSWHHLHLAVTIGTIFWVCAILLTLSPMKCSKWLRQPWALWLCSLFALVPAWAAIVLLDQLQFHAGVFYVILITACCDTFAYFTGRLIGKHKLAPTLSPKKTIEGALGGVIIATLVASIYVCWVNPDDTFKHYVILGASAILCVVSIFGDLFESLYKRQCGVKDSGAILPGHGGILDRIDSIIAVLPVFALLQESLKIFN